eukprot:m.123814 g.123814  ORF g.123814 m.123814 type:complete len:305 (+) comp11134_c0_seq4:233-1147(+)
MPPGGEVSANAAACPKSITRSPTPPLRKVTRVISQAERNVAGVANKVVQRTETHREKFETEDERNDAIFGYMTVCAVNVLSCGSLALFFAGYLTALGEINCELAFLLIKWVIEARTGKLTVPLIVHHSIMVVGFVAVQFPVFLCYVWVVVHAQLVHIPFSLRSIWRLMMPQLRLVPTSLSWTREVVDGAFWATWMGLCGYRSVLILLYASWGMIVADLRSQAMLAGACAVGLAVLDRAWTHAMWPKPADIGPTFVMRARVSFVLGLLLSGVVFAADMYPELLGGWEMHYRPTRACLLAQESAQA